MEWERLKTFSVAARPQQMGYGMEGDQIIMEMTQTAMPVDLVPEQKLMEPVDQAEKMEAADSAAGDLNFISANSEPK